MLNISHFRRSFSERREKGDTDIVNSVDILQSDVVALPSIDLVYKCNI